VIQILTGCFLAMHYIPNVDLAFNSVEHIMRDVDNGYILRYTHANVASFFFIFVYALNYKIIISNTLFYSNLHFACNPLGFKPTDLNSRISGFIFARYLAENYNLIIKFCKLTFLLSTLRACCLLFNKALSDTFLKIFRPLDYSRLSGLDTKDIDNKNPEKKLDNKFLQ
jgi:hypothetical protein